ncbi:MAG: 3'(2'),5'-bisphosphate nucleotidase CysQ [Pseudomonadota bacterium]
MQEPEERAPDLALLLEAAKDAGKIALSHFRAAPKTWEKGGGAGPVTEADIAVDTMLRETLRAARPGYGWLSEETEDDRSRLSAEDVFIVDPIDGTRSFIGGSETWAVSLAVARRGVVRAGVVYLPAKGLTFAAARGQGASLNGDRIEVSQPADPALAHVLSAKVNFTKAHWQSVPPRPLLSFRSSLAYRLALIAQGRFDAMITLRDTWEWDIAAGSLIVEEAGGRVVTTAGDAPRFNTPRAALAGVLAGAPGLISHYAACGPRLMAA